MYKKILNIVFGGGGRPTGGVSGFGYIKGLKGEMLSIKMSACKIF